jgi:putative PIN family toxin of toxin-antitoxin system
MGSITKVVIDTNVCISAFGWDGKPEAVLRLLEQRRITNYTTDDIYDELRRVVAYPKLKFSASLQAKILEFIFCWSVFVSTSEPVAVVADDPDDDKFIACAIAAGTSHIISGDPHLLSVGSYQNIRISTPTQFLESFDK